MGYAKLFSSIIHSTIWREADHVRIVWVTMLAMSDENGIVETSVPGLADAARVNLQECIDALNRLQAPDEYSRCPDNEGRRLEKVDGGFEILNYEKYRRKCTEEERRERNAEKQKRWRERQKNVTNSNQPLPPVTDRNQALPEITDVTKITQSDQIRSEQLRSEEKEIKKKNYPSDFEAFRCAYPQHRLGGKGQDFKSWQVAKKAGMDTGIALASLVKWKASPKWKSDGGKYIVAISKWLRDGYWETEPLNFEPSFEFRRNEPSPQYEDLNKIFGRVIPDGTNTPK